MVSSSKWIVAGLAGAGASVAFAEPAFAAGAMRSTGYVIQQLVNACLVGALYSLDTGKVEIIA